MKLTFKTVIFLSLLTLITCQIPLQTHQLTTLEVSNLNEWTYHNLKRHDKQHHEASSGQNLLVFLIAKYLLGPIMFLASFATICLNQKKAVLDHKRLTLAEAICHEVNQSNKQQITQNQGQLTYVSGQGKTNNPITDQISTLSIQNSLKLIRTVEVMQWRAKNPQNKSHNVEYTLDWCSINQSAVYGKSNPPQNWFMNTQTLYNPNVFIGEYNISANQIDMCKQTQKIIPTMQLVQQIGIRKNLKQKGIIIGDYICFASPVNNQMDGQGALRIKYQYCPVGPLTIVAKTVNRTFQPFPIAQYQNNGIKIQDDQLPIGCIFCACVGQYLVPITEINLLFQKTLTKEQIFNQKLKQTQKFTFIVRGISFLMMIGGFCLLFSPLIDILGFVPLVGGFIKGSLILVVTVGGFIICIPLWIITFSIAWTWYHPKVGCIFLGIGLSILSAIIIYNQVSKGSNQQQVTQVHYHLKGLQIN